ncbi:hypothetical protein [Actinacidiphila bryophytorum]|uniref:Secreted protein n=1 Tax=Actinacidiphila bryophytorum TaxID=1436133 RepID=A0A9W4MHE7_9ACTN|nr:hypothetical protein [Actinacidiphila bryophytorum]MBM9440275.1 hypothetical protein [Actinacidiphila bryophytorum]MBN6545682.1 hypothetical protein [Actinacidiphila bryophytorum]CAG7658532.1 conserved exported hypothetical protein [Actinacidiphila bryophytorum]
MRKTFLTTTLAAAAAVGFAAAPAHAAAVDMPFSMAYGNSQTSGSIHFTSGYTASLSGVVHAASGQRAICADGYNGSVEAGGGCSDWASAGGPDATLNTSFSINLPGGVQRVVIYMLEEHGDTVASEYCTRSGCTRTL